MPIQKNKIREGIIIFTSDSEIHYGKISGSPEGTVDAPIGSIYSDVSTGSVYHKTTASGVSTGWYNLNVINGDGSPIGVVEAYTGVAYNDVTNDVLYIKNGTGTTGWIKIAESGAIAIDHDSTTNISGGTSGEYNHLSNADYTNLTELTSSYIYVGNASNAPTQVEMTGEASISNLGVITLQNDSVVAKTITGYLSTEGTISATDSIVDAISKLNGNLVGLDAYGITSTDISNWNTAYGWGDHSTVGYLTSVAFGDLTSTPTTLAGYGITDYYTDSDAISAVAGAGYALQSWVSSNYQPLNTNLTSISSLSTITTGLIKLTNGVASLDTTSYVSTETDPVFTASDAFGITSIDIGNWNTAYGWGNHASAGYLTSVAFGDLTSTPTTLAGYGITDYYTDSDAVSAVSAAGYALQSWVSSNYQPLNANLTSISSLSTASTGLIKLTNGVASLDTATYLTTETDPVFVASDAYGITSTDISNWDTAYGWGDHSSAGYITSTSTSTLTNKSLVDSTTYFIDNTDNTKIMQFELSGITTGTTRVVTLPDKDGTLAMLSDISASGMTSFILAGDSGSSQTITDGNTLTISGGTGIDTVASDTDTLTVNIDSTVVTLTGTQSLTNKSLSDSTTYFIDETDNSKKAQFQLSGITTATTRTLTIPDSDGTIALSENVLSTSLTSSYIFVGNGSGVATGVAMSSEASISNTGAVTLTNDSVIAKTLTGFTSGTGTVTSSDSILSSIQKIDANANAKVGTEATNSVTTVAVVSALPGTPDANTLYFIME